MNAQMSTQPLKHFLQIYEQDPSMIHQFPKYSYTGKPQVVSRCIPSNLWLYFILVADLVHFVNDAGRFEPSLSGCTTFKLDD